MSTIPLYNALVKAGVDPKEAEAAIDGFANAERVEKMADKLDKVTADVAVMKWMIGANLALSIGILLKLLVP